MTRKIALLAVGGNALLREGEWGHQEDQLANARETAEMLARVVAEGYALCVVHGNGPQVGNLLIQFHMGNMRDDLARKSMRLFATEVAPRLREDSRVSFASNFPELVD